MQQQLYIGVHCESFRRKEYSGEMRNKEDSFDSDKLFHQLSLIADRWNIASLKCKAQKQRSGDDRSGVEARSEAELIKSDVRAFVALVAD